MPVFHFLNLRGGGELAAGPARVGVKLGQVFNPIYRARGGLSLQVWFISLWGVENARAMTQDQGVKNFAATQPGRSL